MSIVVGFAPQKEDYGGLELAALLGRSSKQDVVAITVVPSRWPTPVAGHVDREFEAWAIARGEASVAEALQVAGDHCLGVDFTATWAHGRSIAGQLMDEAISRKASVLVVGSGHDGRYGYVNVSSGADRLLHSSEVPVAIATRGFEVGGEARVSRTTCAFRGDEVSRRTLSAAARLCGENGAALRIATFAVRGRTMFPPDGANIGAEDMIMERWLDQAETAQKEAITLAQSVDPAPSSVTAEIGAGRSWASAMGSLEWREDEALVIGSSSAGSLARIFLGSSAHKILRHSPVPVVVVP